MRSPRLPVLAVLALTASRAQVGAAFDALRTWANTGARPAGGEIP
jgi:hypothetical protein